MCGRFTLLHGEGDIRDFFSLKGEIEASKPRYNISPSQTCSIIAWKDGFHTIRAEWGLIPGWTKPTAKPKILINTRSESVEEKPSFRRAFVNTRCLIPASGFFEWVGKEGWYISPKDGQILAFAGLWDRWVTSGGEERKTFSVITTEANESLASIHHRMPVILPKNEFQTWMQSPKQAELKSLLKACPNDYLQARRVGPHVNSSRNEGPECLEPPVPELPF